MRVTQLIQRRCKVCNGSGLVDRRGFLRKCPQCGGFFPWQGWAQFLSATATPGNGGVRHCYNKSQPTFDLCGACGCQANCPQHFARFATGTKRTIFLTHTPMLVLPKLHASFCHSWNYACMHDSCFICPCRRSAAAERADQHLLHSAPPKRHQRRDQGVTERI